MIIRDVSYYETHDKDGKLIKQQTHVCFGLFASDREYGAELLKGATHLSVYFAHYTSRKTTEVFLNLLRKSGLLLDIITVDLISSLPDGIKPIGSHDDVKRFVKITFPLLEMSMQKIYFIYAVLRMLQNEPRTLYLMRKFAHHNMEIIKLIGACTWLGYWSSRDKFNTESDTKSHAGFHTCHHTLTSAYGCGAKTTVEEFYKRLDHKYKVKKVPEQGYNIDLEGTWTGYTQAIFQSQGQLTHPKIKASRMKKDLILKFFP